MKKTALFCGSFDPIHDGHISLIRKALGREADRVLVAVCGNPNKNGHYAFGTVEAGALTAWNLSRVGFGDDRVRVITSEHSALTICLDFGCDIFLRGFRTPEEKQEEQRHFDFLKGMLPSWTELLLVEADTELADLSSSKVRFLTREHMDAEGVPLGTAAVMDRVLNRRTVVAVMGPRGAGKTVLCERLSRGGSFAHYDPRRAVEEILRGNSPGEVRMRKEIGGEVSWSQSFSKGTKEFFRAVQGLGSEECIKVGKLLLPYRNRHWRRFSKSTKAEIVLYEETHVSALARSRNFAVVVGKGEKADELAELASREKEQEGFGRVIRFVVAPGDSDYPKRVGELAIAIHEQIRETERFAGRFAVSTHEEVLRDGLWRGGGV